MCTTFSQLHRKRYCNLDILIITFYIICRSNKWLIPEKGFLHKKPHRADTKKTPRVHPMGYKILGKRYVIAYAL